MFYLTNISGTSAIFPTASPSQSVCAIISDFSFIMGDDSQRHLSLESYRLKVIESREWEAKLKSLRLELKDLQREFDFTEENIKALQSVGQIIGEVLKQLDHERCELFTASYLFSKAKTYSSHCQGLIWSAICCRMPLQGGQGQIEARNPRRS